MKKRLSALAAVATAATVLCLPAMASAAPTPVQLTHWSPVADDGGSAGLWNAVAINPSNGRQLIVGYRYPGAQEYFAAVFTAAGTQIGEAQSLEPNLEVGGYLGFGAGYNPVTGGWVVAYIQKASDRVVARFLDADGSPSGPSKPLMPAQTTSDCCWSVDLAYDSRHQRFLVAETDYDGETPHGRLVTATGTVLGTGDFQLLSDPSALDFGNYHQLAIDYSTKQDNFGLVTKAGSNTDPSLPDRPWFQLLDHDGSPVGSQRMLTSNSPAAVTNASLAYNPSRDEYGVVWQDYASVGTDHKPMIQRISASSGSPVGSPVEQEIAPTMPSGSSSAGSRVQIVAHPTADEYYLASVALYSDEVGFPVDWTAAGNGTQNVSTLEWLLDRNVFSPYAQRPQVAFDPHACSYLAITAASEDAGDSWNLWESRTKAPSRCTASVKPTLKKKGTAGATSLKVKVGCAAAGSCRIKLSGKLVGGKGKVKGVTSKGSGKRTVKLAYTDELISELAADGGGKIRITAREVGGGSKTITVTVPAAVTG